VKTGDFNRIRIQNTTATIVAAELYGLKGEISELPGDLDFNFKITCEKNSYILKISRPDADQNFLRFQNDLLLYLNKQEKEFEIPQPVADLKGNFVSHFRDKTGNKRDTRVLKWIEGRLWSEVNPVGLSLWNSLGMKAGQITSYLSGFDHEFAHRYFDWDVANGLWVKEYLAVFNAEELELINYFIVLFEDHFPAYLTLRKSVVHMDANDNNIIVDASLQSPEVKSIIDFGDATYTQTINDLAIALAYAMMGQQDPLATASSVTKAYHSQFPLEEGELEFLYVLTAMRLVISVTKSTINSSAEPENGYHQISRKPAWKLLKKWRRINPNLAWYSFRNACNLPAHPNKHSFEEWISQQHFSIGQLFPEKTDNPLIPVDLGLESSLLGHRKEFEDLDHLAYKMNRLSLAHNNAVLYGGYKEIRPFYTTKAFQKEGNNGPEYRTAHLGVDFWLSAGSAVHALFDGEVFSIYNNDNNKDYGPTLILSHKTENGFPFYTLYGHLSRSSLNILKTGSKVKKGQLIAYIGDQTENGGWVPHLHFQIMLDMLHYKSDFPGVAFPQEKELWASICPDPKLIFRWEEPEKPSNNLKSEILRYRQNHLGKSMSLSYQDPLYMVRGEENYLIDHTGRKYLDTVNNVAHTGHENYSVFNAARSQMAILNTNTRYLNTKINEFTQELLSTLPSELCVVHMVNSGSEANELALRMATAYTGQKDVIALEQGYHGNTNACIDVSSYKFDGKAGKGAPEHTHIVPLPDAFRGIYRGKLTAKNYAGHIDEKIKIIQSKGLNVSAFLSEIIISCGGQIELPANYLKYVYQSIRNAGGICIADEVQHGCGRVGSHFWAFQLHEVVPDIVTIGKPIGNGHPIGVVVCTRQVADAFANGMEYFNTFGGNPVSSAIGLQVLREIKKEKLQENALNTGSYMKDAFNDLKSVFPIIGEVRGQGLFLGLELTDRDKIPMTKQAAYLSNRMKELGILMSTDGKDENVLKIKPPMTFSKEHATELIKRFKSVLQEDFMQI